MPVTIVTPVGPAFGPGLAIQLQSNVITDQGQETDWFIRVTGGAQEREILFQHLRGTGSTAAGVIGFSVAHPVPTPTYAPPVSTGISIDINVQSPGTGEIDTGQIPGYQWEPQLAAWALAQQLQQVGGQGGLTGEQAQQLADTERRTLVLGEPTDLTLGTPSGPIPTTLANIFSRNTLDQLTMQEVTNGPTCEPVRASFSFWQYGVVVRVTTIAPDLARKTPDDQWYFPDLAVLRVFRGADLQYRRGIHTPTFLSQNAWEWGANFRNLLDVLGVPPDNTLAVDWRQGCCGQVFFLKWP